MSPAPALPCPIPLDAIRSARRRLEAQGIVGRFVTAAGPGFDGLPTRIVLALENLSPIGSFKLRGAGNAIAALDEPERSAGLVTASAGNMAQGVAWHARRLGLPTTTIVPDTAPRAKLDAIEALGARTVAVSPERWWQVLEERRFPGESGHFLHPVAEETVLAGNATLGLELAERFESLDAVLVPFGGGGLACGIASALAAVAPRTRVFAVEVEGRAPLAASLAAGHPVQIEPRASFVDGIGGRTVLPEMWPLAATLLAGSLVVSEEAVADALGRLIRDVHVVAEGAGAAPVAAAIAGLPELEGARRVACVVSGGNLDAELLAPILLGEMP